MKYISWQVVLALILIVLSVVFYGLHYVLFRDAHHIFIYLVGDIAFVFIEVLMVTIIIHRVLEERERKARLEKLNMVIGAFFSEMGTKMLGLLSDLDRNREGLQKEFLVDKEWSGKEFSGAAARIKRHQYELEIERVDWLDLRDLLVNKRDFMLRLLENPNLLEHESFTELLRAAFHLTEELMARQDLGKLPDSDNKHLSGDVTRVYMRMTVQWLDYMKYLKTSHPYLFSLALRTNPFDENASPVVREPA